MKNNYYRTKSTDILGSHHCHGDSTHVTCFCRGFYVGTSSLEEGLSVEQCCTFRGSFSKFDVRSGTILSQTFMLPNNYGKLGGYAGAAIYGSTLPLIFKETMFTLLQEIYTQFP